MRGCKSGLNPRGTETGCLRSLGRLFSADSVSVNIALAPTHDIRLPQRSSLQPNRARKRVPKWRTGTRYITLTRNSPPYLAVALFTISRNFFSFSVMVFSGP